MVAFRFVLLVRDHVPPVAELANPTIWLKYAPPFKTPTKGEYATGNVLVDDARSKPITKQGFETASEFIVSVVFSVEFSIVLRSTEM